MTPQDVLKLCEEKSVQFIDLRFMGAAEHCEPRKSPHSSGRQLRRSGTGLIVLEIAIFFSTLLHKSPPEYREPCPSDSEFCEKSTEFQAV